MTEHMVVHTTPIEELIEKLGVEAVFGKPTSEGEITIIPVAQVDLGFGYGGGYGQGPDNAPAGAADATTTARAEGGGSGGGGGGRATPRGYLHISPDGVKYEPIMDLTRVPLAGILLAAWSVFWITATVRAIAKAVAQRKRPS
jgi:uncharacterized spore protein YtfJ